MTVYELMAKLGAAGIKLWVEDGQLKFKAPKGALTADLKQHLVAQKAAVIAFLSETRIGESGGESQIPLADRSQPLPLSHAQQRLWFIEQLTPGSSTFHIPAALYLTGILDVPALQRAFLQLIQRHEALRTLFIQEGEEPTQVIQDVDHFEIPFESLLDLPEEQRLAEVKARVEKEVRTSFDLGAGLPIRARLYQLDDNKHGLIVTMHHIVTDGWSMGIFVREISALYAAQRMGAQAPLPELQIQYADFAAWQREWLHGDELERQLGYWRRDLDRAPAQLALPFDRPRPALQTLNGATQDLQLSPATLASLRAVARAFDTTLYVVMLTAYKVVLAKWAQQNDVCVGMPIAGRTRAEVEGLIGFFVNTLVIRTQLDGNPSLREILAQVKEKVLGAQSHQDVPFEAIVEELNTPRNLSFSPLYQVAMSLTSGEGTAKKAMVGGLEIEPMPIELVAARLDMTLMLVDHGDSVDGMLEYNTDLFDAQTMALFLEHFQTALQLLGDNLDLRIAALGLYEPEALINTLGQGQPVAAVLPLTPMQRDFCLDSLREPDSNRNTIGYYVRVPELPSAQVIAALQSVADANPFLRSRIRAGTLPGSEPLYQVILEQDAIQLQTLDWRSSDMEANDATLTALALPSWNVDDQPLIRYFWVDADAGEHYLVVAAHHAIFDGISKLRHFQQFAAALKGEALAAVPVAQVSQWVTERAAKFDRADSLAFWANQLSEYDTPALKKPDAGAVVVHSWSIEGPAFACLARWCEANSVSLANYLRTLYTLALQQCFYHSEPFVLVDAAGGRDATTEHWLGCAFQFVPHIQHRPEADGVLDLLQQNRAWKKSVGDAQFVSMLARSTLVSKEALEFQYNYRLPEISGPVDLLGEPAILCPVQPDNAGTVKLLVTPAATSVQLRLSHRQHEFNGFDLLQRMSQVHDQIQAGATGLQELDWLLPQERKQLLQFAQGQIRDVGPNLLQRFEAQVKKQPDAVAVIHGERSLTYGQLDTLSNQVANLLLAKGVSRSAKVALCVSRNLNLLPLFLGVIKTGAAYVPLDVNYPAERIAFIVEDSGAELLITEQCVCERWLPGQAQPQPSRMLLADELETLLAGVSHSAPAVTIDPEDTLYYVYTSGSTGQPKGAGVYHRGEANLLDWYLELLQPNAEDRFLLISALGFDLTQKNLFAPLCSGAALVLPSSEAYDPDSLLVDIARHRVSIINGAPSAFYPLLESAEHTGSLRHLVMGGEPIRVDLVREWLARPGIRATLTNSYGPTECSDVVAYYSTSSLPSEQAVIPVGQPIANTHLYVVNQQGNLMPLGAAGELRIAGAGVGAGYWNRPDLDADVFSSCPYGASRWYRTGDICRLNSNLEIEYIGRTDFQVKLRGLRIELGEVDAQLKALSGVKDALCLVRNDTLIGYVLADNALDADQVRPLLANTLPEFMVPAAIVTVPVWPLTPNGKIDRKALPEPVLDGSGEFVAPRNDSEQQIADIWCQVLKRSEISVKANFFEAGGHSLLATQVVSRIRKAFAVEISVRALFEAPTIEKLVRYISTAAAPSADAPPLLPLDPPNRDTLSFAQYRLWFVDQLNQGSSEYNLPSALKISGPLDVSVLDRVFGEIVARHEVLRTNFGDADGIPQLIVHEPRAWHSEIEDLTGLSAQQQQQRVTQLVDEDAARVYSLQQEPLLSTRIVKLAPHTHILLLNMHHIVSDGWSLGVMVQEIQALYPAFVAGQPSPLPPLPIQYSDFAVWQRNWLQGTTLEALREYWQEALRGAPDVLRLPTDKPRPKHQTFNGAHFSLQLGSALSDKLNRFCEQRDLTPFMVLMGAYQILLSRYSGQRDICVGIPIAGRNRAELEGLIGFFINGLVIRTRMEGNPSAEDYLQQVKEVALGAYAHQDMPADLLLDAIKLERTADTSPGAQVGFALQNVAQENLQAEAAGLTIETVPREHKTAKYELSLILQESEEGFGGVFEYNTDLFLESSIARMSRHFVRLLEQMIDQPEHMIDQLELFPLDSLYELLELDASQCALRTLSPMQRDMYLDTLLEPDTLKNSLGYHFITDGEFDVEQWVTVSQQMVQQHPLLRARILRVDLPYTDVAYLHIPHEGAINLTVEDWSQRQTSDAEAADHARNLIWQPYDIHGELSQYFVIKLNGGRHLVVFRMNHIVLDGAGMAVHLMNAIAGAEALKSGQACPAVPDIFDQYVEDNSRRTDSAAVLQFWQQQSQSLEALDFSLPPEHQGHGVRVEKSLRLPDAHWQRLQAFCREQKITPSLYFKALYGLLINAYCRGEDDFYISEVVGGRVGQHKRAFGNYFQVLPVVFPKHLFVDHAPVSALFEHIRQYRKSLRTHANISLLAQRRLLPQGRLHFMFNYYNFIPSMTLHGTEIKLKAYPQVQDGPVQFVVQEQDGYLDLNLIYLDDLFTDLAFLQRIEHLSEQVLEEAVEGVATSTRKATGKAGMDIQSLELRLNAELSSTGKITRDESSADAGLHYPTVVHGFLQQVQLTPAAVAVQQGTRQLSYQALDQQSSALAAHLHSLGVEKGHRVGICLDRSVELLVSVLAVLKCGAAYVPMDSNYPPERLAYILRDSAASIGASAPVLITQRCVRERLTGIIDAADCALVELDGDTRWRDAAAATVMPFSALTSPHLPSADDTIYVIYTSGSTGQPKGAQVTHGGEVNLQNWYVNDLGIGAEDRFLLVSAFGFDLTQKNLFAPLLVGGCLVIPEMDEFDLDVVAGTLVRERITVVNCAPSAFYPLVEDGSTPGYPFPDLRYLVLGGEPIRLPALQGWLAQSRCKLVNSYGPTECTDVVAYHIHDPQQSSLQQGSGLPIGNAIGGADLFVVDSADHRLPAGIVGELCIAGSCVGQGYVNKPELTAAVFNPNPYGAGQWYRTGDLVRQRADGAIDYIGRKDFQVKIRGLRIELGEIEAALKRISGVVDSLTLVRNEQLIAYVVSAQNQSTEQVRSTLRQSLPDYMVPAVVVTLPRWPLTPNGKVDRNALPDPEHSGRPEYVAPRNETEEKLVEIWREVLGVEKIGIHDSFFDLGGHSLLAARAVAKFRQVFEVDIQLRSLFELHTVADIAQYLDTMKWAAQAAEQASGGESEAGRDEGFL
ncbi:non-ribosomal peptide synthetase [Ketobacter sp.]|uniref:non-ribosomal peptide synthetase n=1 Tax=Ketobacter sp. TaxID=2083498 RepID=UPI000F2C33BD|nr:non-ribosomal peptide synthetase [Ketobacter sp.]RLT97982.1 MAG: amino acid adenylation domain-containing protein [Ketobacter sp.]